MTVEVGGAGTLGVAFETTLGTYLAPTKWIPIRSETLAKVEEKVWRTNIRGVADRSGAVQGYTHVEGDVTFEVTSDVLPYFLYAARTTPAKSGTGPYTYTFTPAHVAQTSTAAGATNRKTLSLLVTRSARPFGYLGCSVGQLAFTLDAGVLLCTATILGVDEVQQSAGTPSWASSVVMGPGKISLEIPTGTPRGDMDTLDLNINDNLVAANRLNGQKKAAYNNWGEREVTLSCEADFDALTDYNAFINQTIQAISLKAVAAAASDEVNVVLNASAMDSFATNLASLGDVNRASLAYHGFYNTTNLYTITCITAENIT